MRPTSSWRVLMLLWKTARKRAAGRVKYRRALRQQKTGSESNALGGLMKVFTIALSCMVHGVLAWTLVGSIEISQIIKWDEQGKMVVPVYLEDNIVDLREAESLLSGAQNETEREAAQKKWNQSAESIARGLDFLRVDTFGGTHTEQREVVLAHCRTHGSEGFMVEKLASLSRPGELTPAFWALAGLVIGWWFLMLVCQGEGLEMDFQRRRHPLWEWLFSHPVRPSAAFSGELLAPLMANPIYLSAPIFWFVILINAHDFWTAFIAAFLIGLPLAVAASCLHKSIEISAMLRLPIRQRGVVLGLMSWAGFVAMFFPLFLHQMETLKGSLLKMLAPAGELPVLWWPWRAMVTGWADHGSWWQAGVTSGAISGFLVIFALALTWWGTRYGLQGNETSGGPAPRRGRPFVRDPCYRKELLWLWRDKGAVVQVVLVPLSIGALQAFNLRGLTGLATANWNLFCGLGIICGTYFLLVIGPRSLVSEGGALWIALTWPKGLETLLKTKARLWWGFSMVIVGLVMIFAVVMFPADWWRILLVATGWFFFSWALSLKAVTLVNAPSSSGEPEPPPRGRKLAAMIGTLAFGAGVMANSWHVATIGVVFTALTSAAMWQNLRARLPFLFDRWSEKLPAAPSLMHSMIGIAATVEVVGIATAVAGGVGGSENLWLTRTIAYGVIGCIAWAFMHHFLEGRGVRAADIWKWPRKEKQLVAWQGLGAAAIAAFALGGLAVLYVAFLKWFPATSAYMESLSKIQSQYIGGIGWQLILAVGLAPLAEEYLFRGLLFRSLDREWGGWKALVGSAAFFAVYHPPVSWVPVFVLGLLTAWLFKKGGRLWASVVLHMIYNLIVILFQS